MTNYQKILFLRNCSFLHQGELHIWHKGLDQIQLLELEVELELELEVELELELEVELAQWVLVDSKVNVRFCQALVVHIAVQLLSQSQHYFCRQSCTWLRADHQRE